MQIIITKTTKLLWSLVVFCTAITAQTTIEGTVFDNDSGEPLPFVNVVFQSSTVGTITDYNGTYFISTNKASDTIVATCLGFESQKIPVRKNTAQHIDFRLSSVSLRIDEVIVTPGENPAFRILDSIKDHKEQNNPERFESVQYKSYNKLRLDLNNIDQAFKDQRLLKQFQFVFEHIDSSEVFGKNYLPILMTESVSRFYQQKSPVVEKEVIEAFKISGIENNTIAQFSGKMYQRLNVYNNFMNLFEPGFVSPIADFGRMYYKYYLEDSANIDGNWCYKIAFKPKRTQERTFFGYLWVADTSFAIKKIQLRVSSDVNINFMNDLVAINEYKQLNDSTWFLFQEDLLIDFYINDKSYGFFGHKHATYSDIELNKPIPENVEKLLTNTYIVEDSLDRTDKYWSINRPTELNQQEEMVYTMVDSVTKVPVFKSVYSIVDMLTDYYFVKGPIEIGPYYTFYSNNPIEGSRIKFGLRTSNEFSTKYRFGGHIAYGLNDQRFKYGFVSDVMFDNNPRRRFSLVYANDMRQLGKSQNAFLDDNIMATLLRRRPNYKLTMVDEYTMEYEHEWFQGFSNTLKMSHYTIYSTPHIPFNQITNEGIIQSVNSLSTSEITLNTHFAYREKYLLGKFERKSLGSVYPTVDLDFTWAPTGILDSKYEYMRFKLRVYDRLETNPFGFTRYWLTAGKIFGDVPYPFLELHDGNETYAYDVFAFNMMNYYEFASDQFASLFIEQHLQGFFLNKIPVFKKFELREVASAKILVGQLSNSNKQVMDFPVGLGELTKPYIEAGFGLENILKIFRVEALWRLSYLDNPDIVKNPGLRVMMQLTF
ncbi:MAG: carboxypeptidase-like regulatory domain-containing protein [Bacteroidales bacterium]|nr:carboxypeptidase-like regulatory domain-containing protein [Bacteroidales bacterium]MBN2818894.1 carboxypeptidase-like regulatory domain-containing protein [Bacteroidales bacterium]